MSKPGHSLFYGSSPSRAALRRRSAAFMAKRPIRITYLTRAMLIDQEFDTDVMWWAYYTLQQRYESLESHQQRAKER
jgi:hypothetical protein